MKRPIYNDQAYIAEKFIAIEEQTNQSARLAFFRINSYKLSLIKSSFGSGWKELTESIQKTLLNYTEPAKVLTDQGYFEGPVKN